MVEKTSLIQGRSGERTQKRRYKNESGQSGEGKYKKRTEWKSRAESKWRGERSGKFRIERQQKWEAVTN